MSQLSLIPPDYTWLVPFDKYGRELPAIVVRAAEWGQAFKWASVAIGNANELGEHATAAELYVAATCVRHLFWSLTGERELVDAELRYHGRLDPLTAVR